MSDNKFNIVYATGLIISDPALLSTLSIVYDKIYLPHPYDLDVDSIELMRWPSKYWDRLESAQSYYSEWKEDWRLLFDAGVLEVLPPAFDAVDNLPSNLGQRLRDELGIKVPHFASSHSLNGSVSLAMHALFSHTTSPEFFYRSPGNTTTNHLRNTLATSLFEFRLPTVGEMTPEKLLAVRAETKSDKAGFIYYLNELVDDVESRLVVTKGDERDAALRTIERKITPELEEYLREKQVMADSMIVNILKKVAKTVGTTLGVIMTPWDFKNYIGVSDLFLDGADSMIENKLKKVANKHRCFQFVSTIEKING